MSVMLTRCPFAERALVAFRPSSVHGTLTTMFSWSAAQRMPSTTMPSTSVAMTSAEMGPSTVLQISRRISSGSPFSLASRLGFVVTPSTTPRVTASRISLRFAVSRKIFMETTSRRPEWSSKRSPPGGSIISRLGSPVDGGGGDSRRRLAPDSLTGAAMDRPNASKDAGLTRP